MDQQESSSIPIQLSQNCVIASIQVNLAERISNTFRQELLDYVHSTGAGGVILDVSGLKLMDLDDWNGLRKTMDMVKVIGAVPIIAGLQPGVVVAIIELGAKTDDVMGVLNTDEAIQLFHKLYKRTSMLDND